MTRNIKLTLEYDGTNYVGWQRQASGRSIQGEIEKVLEQVLQGHCDVIGAGRTDAGVHARGQVANFRTDAAMDIARISAALNGLLPDDIVVHACEETSFEFHARHSAKARSYSYQILQRPTALLRAFSWFVPYTLDYASLIACALQISGTHDFSSFAKKNPEITSYECIVSEACWTLQEFSLRFEIRANRFLHGMVRALVGTMVDVARGFMPMEEFSALFSAVDRSEAGMAAPARGLVLERVDY
ncbi:MAG TPA: tRNA pseudouridine(38-40) synthase TruA [Bacteroidota bacterium]|nr:tRNA pseudouridine(38-40) synthase TruA [Bacteroidota bacterium]